MNDERPIEKLLRRYARKRRDDAGPPVGLHPATRRLLQGEVARQFRKDASGAAPSSFAQMLKGWRWQLAWAVPLFALVALSLWSLLDRPETKQLALGPTTQQTVAADESRAFKGERREPEPLPSTLDARRSTAGETAPADFSAVKTPGPSPSSVPVRSLNQAEPGFADPDVARKNQDAKQALEFAPAPNQPGVSLASVAEQKGDPVRDGFKEMARADKLGVASDGPTARFAKAPSANRVDTLPADPTAQPIATLQPDRGNAGASAANQQKMNESRARSLDTKAAESVPLLLDTSDPSQKLAYRETIERDQAQTYSQSFANRASATLKQKAAKAIVPNTLSPVLANFRVEQTGRRLRVLDGDGSMYLGETDAPPEIWAGHVAASAERGNRSGVYAAGAGGKTAQAVQLFKSDGKLNQLPAAAKSVPEPQPQTNWYRVTGTNRTLNQTVVFTWSFVELTNAALAAEPRKIGGELNKDANKLPTQFPAQLQNSVITGRAQFGTGKEIEINAVPVSP